MSNMFWKLPIIITGKQHRTKAQAAITIIVWVTSNWKKSVFSVCIIFIAVFRGASEA